MGLELDSATWAEVNAASAASARAAAVIAALSNPVVFRVYNGAGTVMGSGTMATPWGVASGDGSVIAVAALASFAVSVAGTPDATWRARFESGARWLRGTFGLTGSGADFQWSGLTWTVGQPGRMAGVSIICQGSALTFGWISEATKSIAFQTDSSYDVTQDAVVPSGMTATYALVPPVTGFSINASSGVLTSSVSSTDEPVTVEMWDGQSEGNWAARSTGSNVVWAHDFSNDAELTNFFLAAISPQLGPVPVRSADGPDGGWCIDYKLLGSTLPGAIASGDSTITVSDASTWPTSDFWVCIGNYAVSQNELVHVVSRSGNVLTVDQRGTNPYGSAFFSAPQNWAADSMIGHHVQQRWNRPFAAFAAPGNGKPVGQNDNAANGAVPLRTWTPIASGGDSYYGGGYYGNSLYHGASSFRGVSNPWEGSEFWLQYRVKVSQNFWDNNRHPTDNQSIVHGIKLAFLQTVISVPHQLCPILSPRYAYAPRNSPWRMFTDYSRRAGDRPQNIFVEPPSGSQGTYQSQPGGAYGTTCLYPVSNQSAGACWEWPGDTWVAVMMHVRPGKHYDPTVTPMPADVKNTLIEVKVAAEGATSWITVYSSDVQAISYGYGDQNYGTSDPAGQVLPGYNAFGPSGYSNVGLSNQPPPRANFSLKFAQVIFSRYEIPLPTADAVPAWAAGLADYEVRSLTGATYGPTNGNETINSVVPSEWLSSSVGLVRPWCGGAADVAGKRLFVHGGGHGDSANNGVYVYDFNGADRPTGWTLAPNSLSAVADVSPSVTVYAADGKPVAVHTYDCQFFANGKLRRVGGCAYSSGNTCDVGYAYDTVTEQWVGGNPATPFVTGLTNGSYSNTLLVSPDGSKVLWLRSAGATFIDVATGTKTNVSGPTIYGSYASATSAYDSDLDRYLTLGAKTSSNDTVFVGEQAILTLVNWNTQTVSHSEITTSSHPLSNLASYINTVDSKGASIVYDNVRKSFWVFGMEKHLTGATMSTQLLEIDSTTFAVTAHTLSAGLPVSTPVRGSFNRHILLTFGQTRVICTAQSVSSPMQCFRIPN
jgi:hypothetical protein